VETGVRCELPVRPGLPDQNQSTDQSTAPADAGRPDAADHAWCRDPRSHDQLLERALVRGQEPAYRPEPEPVPECRRRSPEPPVRRGPPLRPRVRRGLRRPHRQTRQNRRPCPAPSWWSSWREQPRHPRRRPSWSSSWPACLLRVRLRGRVLVRVPSSPASSRRRRRAWWTDSSRESNSPWRVRSTRHWSCRVSWRGRRL